MAKKKTNVTMKEKTVEMKEKKNAGGLFIPAGIFLGLGFGFAFNNVPAGLFLGLGIGFIAFAISACCTGCCCKRKD